jgi:regulator of sigma E protease
MSIAIAILTLSVLIIVHELGHFAAAKLVGVRVLEFSVFMGPKLFSFTRGGTEYSLRALPIGGACRMEGEEESSGGEGAYYKKPKWARALILAAGPAMNLLTAFCFVLVLVFRWGYVSTVVLALPHGSPLLEAQVPLQAGDEILSYGGKATHSAFDLAIYAQDRGAAPAEVAFRRGGETLRTEVVPARTPADYYQIGVVVNAYNGDDWNVVTAVTPGGAADQAGMREGDRLLAVDGQAPGDVEGLRGILEASGGAEVAIEYERGGEALSGSGVPAAVHGEVDAYSLEASFEAVVRPGFWDGLSHAAFELGTYSRSVLYSFKWLVTGSVGVSQLQGPVGIVATIGDTVDSAVASAEDAGQKVEAALYNLLNIAALIGVNLGLFNLIPFPALDGSKLLLLAVEAVRRKAIPPEREMAISMVGMVVLMALMAFTLFNDIGRLVGR